MATENPRSGAALPSGPTGGVQQSAQFLDDLASLSDDDFFRRLSSLRAEHKKTLMHYEKLYHEKLLAENGGDIGVLFGEPLFSTTSTTQRGTKDLDLTKTKVEDKGLYVSGSGLNLSARPPTPSKEKERVEEEKGDDKDAEVEETGNTEDVDDGLGRNYELPLEEPVNTTSDTFNQSLEVVRRSADKPPRSPCPIHKCKEAWTEVDDPMTLLRTRRDSSGDEMDYAQYDETRYQKEKDAALDRIEAMWDDFHVDDYKEQSKRPKSAERKRSDPWRNRITMPEPFRMTIREENKVKQPSRTLLEYKYKKEMDVMIDKFECDKKFRAAPVPAHVYLPLYEELQQKAETKRRTNVQVAKDVLKSQEKPFKFNERQKEIPEHGRRHSAPIVKNKQFKANPIPKSVYEDVTERLLEEEEYRKIRIKMRSKELLRSASLPPRMASNEQYTVGRLKEKLKQQKNKEPTKTKKFQPRIKKKMPDFDAIHRKQQKEALNRSRNHEAKVATVCEPFNLRTSTIPSSMDKILNDIRQDEEMLAENRWPYKNPRSKPKLGEVRRSYDTLPTTSTTADQLRASKTYDEIRKKSAKDHQDEVNRKRQHELAKHRRRQIAELAAANDQSRDLEFTNAMKLRQHREEERRREEEYRRELAEMEERVSKKPFLFELQSQVNARKRAEKRFADTLRDAGVDDVSLSSLTRPTSLSRGPRSPEHVPDLSDDDLVPTRDQDDATDDDVCDVADDDDGDVASGDDQYSETFEVADDTSLKS